MSATMEAIVYNVSPGERRGSCPVCSCPTVERKGGEWCPRCQGWLQFVSEFGIHVWRVTRPLP